MSLLTDQELARICNGWPGNAEKAARAIEQAVIAKLATVSVEPHEYVWEPDGTFNIGQERCLSPQTGPCHGWNIYPVYTATAIAAVRVQAINEALNCYSPDDTATDWADKIRALIGAKE